MQRYFAIFSILVLLFMQFSTSTVIAVESTKLNQNRFELQAKDGSTQNKATVELKTLSSNFDSVNIKLPQATEYNDKITEDLQQEAVEIIYDNKNHSLYIEWDENIQQDASFVLVDLQNTTNELIIQGIAQDEVVEESHSFKLAEIIVEINEEAQEEPKVEDKEESREEPKSEDKEESREEPKSEDKEESREEPKSEDKEESKEELKVEDKKKDKKEPKAEIKQESYKKSKDVTSASDETLGDLNTYIGIGPVFETALSGADADFRLTLKLTGSKRTYKNVDVVIDLPLTEYVTFDDSQDNLDRLAIDGVSPMFDSETNQLKYHFAEIKRGQMYEKIVALNTENGYIPNNTSLKVDASISGEVHYTENDEKEEAQKGDVVSFEYKDSGSMNFTASGSLSLSKFRVQENENKYGDSSIVARGEEVLWKLELEIPKKERGQLFLNPDKKIKITDTLPAGLEYIETISADKPTSVNGQIITWEFSTDDFKTQEEKGKILSAKDIVIKTKVKDNATIGEKMNNATASATFIENSDVIDTANRGVLVSKDNPSTGEIYGTVTRPSHLGPDPNSGNGLGTNNKKNPNPTVTDDAILKFAHGITGIFESFPDGVDKPAKNFKEFQSLYEIDENLNLESVKLPGPFRYQPSNQDPADQYFGFQPQFDVKAKIDGGNFKILIPASEVIPGKVYTREELGLLPGQKVNEIKFEFKKGYDGIPGDVAPGGLRSQSQVLYEFSIDKGYTGVVENSFNLTGVNGNNVRFNDREKNSQYYNNNLDTDISGPRQATVVAYGQNANPVGRVGVKLLEDVRSVVTLGKNRMQIELANINNSGAPMNKQLETVVLLPPGVILHEDVNPSYTNAKGDSTEEASYEVVEENYNGSGRQLVKVKWNDSRITKGQNLLAELDVYIQDHAPNQLTFDVYGFSSDAGLRAPNATEGGITDTVLQTDTEDLNGNGNKEQPRLKSGNIYSLAGKYDIQTEKLIKGPNDEEYSKFTLAPFEGTVDYKLKMTNTTGKNLSIMTLIDVLPTVGDLGITDNINRGSIFEPILEGPITLPAAWIDKVNVFYSTAKNPERDDLTRHTDYLPNTEHLTNPEGAEAPNWIKASAVTDWSTIHSFKIELQKGDTWIKGQDIEIDFSMIMPKESDLPKEVDGEEVVKNLDLVPQQRAAWNSFAVATDTGQPVEPERVGVALELDPPETPDVGKEVEDSDGEYGKDLVEKEREKEYNYRVNTDVPKNLQGYEYITLEDELDKRLDVKKAVALVDGKEVDYKVEIDGQLVTLIVDRDQLDEIAGQKLTLQITAQIKAGVEVEVIDNDATIQVNNNPTKDSNKVPVTPPPPETPEVEKEVEGNDGTYGKDLVEKEFEKEYNYQINTDVPANVVGYEHITLTDTLDDQLDIVSAVALVDGEEVDYEVTIDDQLVTLKVDRAQLDKIAGQTLTLQITAKIKEGTEIVIIDNKAEIQVNDNPSEDSNIVPVNPPPEVPEIEKDIDGVKAEEAVVKLRGQKYDYNVTSTLPENVTGYKTVAISDELDERLTIEDTKVLVDGKASDLEVVTKGQLVTISLNEAQIKELAGKEIQLVITATINADAAIEVIDNQASIQVNDNPTIDSNIVPVIPPTTPNIEKDVEGTDHIGIDFDKEYNYNVKTELPTNIKEYERFIITDKVDKGLVVNADEVRATVDGQAYDGLTVTVEGNDVKVEVTNFAGLDGKAQIELVIPAKIHPDTNMADYTDNKIPNTADLDFTNESDEDSKITTKPVTVTPPPTPDVEKEVEGNDGVYGTELVEKEREKEYKYRVKTVIPEDLTGYTYVTIADELDERLDVKGAIALVDGEEVDYKVEIKDQLVTLKVDRKQLDGIVGKELTLQITAQIKANVEIEIIDNQATIQVNDNPTKDSNKVPVTPPPSETPDIVKEVEGNDGAYGKDLVEKEFEKEFNYQVNTVIPENVVGYKHITLTDTLDERLAVVSGVALVDGKEVDYEVTIEDQLVTLKVERAQLNEIAGQKLTLQITAKIKAGTEVVIIDNKAEIQVNDNPKEDSNIVPVMPPPENPEIEKDIDGVKAEEAVEKLRGESYEYNVTSTLPENVTGYKTVTISDELDERLTIEGTKVLVDGEASDLEVVTKGQLVTLSLDADQIKELAGKEIKIVITAKINADVEIEVIDNQANIQVNENPKIDSNVVPVTPPPSETPDIEKEVEGNDGAYGKDLVEKEFEKEFNYQVNTVIPENVVGYKHITLTDTLDEKLDVVSAVALVDGKEVDYEVTIEDQLVTLKVERAQLNEIAGQKLTLQITAKIKDGTEVVIIDNKAEIQVNDNPSEDSNVVPVMPPPEIPEIEKDIDGEKAEEAVVKLRGQKYDYNVTSTLPENVTGYKTVIISDELDERLTIEGTKVLVDGEASDLEVVTKGQLVTISLNEAQIKELAGKEIQLVITATINADAEIEVIDNQASIQVNDNPTIDSNIVPVIPPTTPNIEKDVEGTDHIGIDFDKEYNYNIKTELPTNIKEYERFIITDIVDKGLVVNADKVRATVDGQAYDGLTVTVEGNNVKVEVTDFAGLEGKAQIELVIPAKIHPDTNMDDYTDNKIPNTADLDFTNESDEDSKITTKPVTVTPPPTPDVEKEVEGNDGVYGKELVEKEFEKEYSYQINTVVPENVLGYEHITLTDTLDEKLDVVSAVALVDGKEVEYEVTIEDQLVTLKVERALLDKIAGQKLTLQITAKIKEGTEVAIIDNKAEIQVNNNPSKDSNIVPVTPPPVDPPTTPEIDKDVEGTDHLDVDYDKEYKYNVITTLPSNIEKYEKFIITDKVDKGLVVNVDKVTATVDGEAYDGLALTVDGNDVKVAVTDFAGLEGKGQIELVITAKIHPDTNIDDYKDNKIPNTADLDFTNESGEDDKLTTKPVTVTPPPPVDPPTTPEISKDVEGKDHLDIDYNKEYKYNIITKLPSNIEAYEQFIITDKVDKGLVVNADKVTATVDGKAYDGLELTVDGNDVQVAVTDFASLEGKGQIELVITAKIHPDTNIDDYKDNKIPNTADLDFTNESGEDDKITTKPVTVTPPPPVDPPTTPEIDKDVEGTDHLDVDYDKEYKYNIITRLPSNIEDYEKFIITDKVDKGLVVNADKVTATVDGKAYDGLELTVDGNDVQVAVTDFAGLEGKGQIELVITAKIHPDTNIDDYKDNKIPNTADLDFTNESGEDDKLTTKPVTVTPPPPVDPPTTPEIDKDVEGTDHLDVDYDKEYKYNIITKLPSNIEDYEKFIITDKVDKGLVVNADKVTATVDGKAYDGLELTIDGNDIKVAVTDFAGLEGKGQIELVITAKIHPDTNIDDYKDNKIPNTADLDFINESGEDDKLTTKPVTVTPPPPVDPPTTPEISKDVEGTDHLDVDYDKEYKYNVITKLPSNIDKYEKFIITDKVDKGLVVNADKVTATVDGKAYDGLELTVDGNDVQVAVTDFVGLEGKGQIELVITAKIHPDTNIDDYKDNKIPNTADLDFINESGAQDKLTTEPVTVTPPPPVDPPTTPEDPEGPKDPEDPKVDGSGDELPKTATNIYNLTLIGFGLMLFSLILFLVGRKRIE